jgi:hypothetical protein
MRELHDGAQRHLPEVRHLRIDERLLVSRLAPSQRPVEKAGQRRPFLRCRAARKAARGPILAPARQIIHRFFEAAVLPLDRGNTRKTLENDRSSVGGCLQETHVLLGFSAQTQSLSVQGRFCPFVERLPIVSEICRL